MEDYKKKYEQALSKAKEQYKDSTMYSNLYLLEEIFPELTKSSIDNSSIDNQIKESLMQYIWDLYHKDFCPPKPSMETCDRWLAWLEKQESVGEIVSRCRTSWYNEGKIQGQIEGLTDDEKYQQGWHDALEKQGDKKHFELTKEEAGEIYTAYLFINYPEECKSESARKHAIEVLEPVVERIFNKFVAEDQDIVWHSVSEAPDEMKELLCEWESNDATWHDIAFYHADTKTFWDGERQVIDVTKWCYVDELVRKHTEQKPSNKIEPKFKVNDWIVNNDSGGVYQVKEIRDDEYCLWPLYAEIQGYLRIIDVDTDYHLWTIEDVKDGDLITNSEMIVIFKGFAEPAYREHIIAHIGLDICGNIQVTNDNWSLGVDRATPATKEQRDLLFQKMEEAGYKWDTEKNGIVAINLKPKFNVGDWITDGEAVFHITSYDIDYGYQLETQKGTSFHFSDEKVENKYHLWDIQDAKDGDVLFQDLMGGKTFIYNGVNPNTAILYSFIISNDGEDVLPYHIGKPNTGIGNIEENKSIIHPATKEQRDLLFQKMEEAGYEWDNHKKDLKKIEQKLGERISISEELYDHIRNAHTCMEDANCSDEELKPKWKQDRYDQAKEDLEEAMKLISVEQKPDKWSEEDEDMKNSILKLLLNEQMKAFVEQYKNCLYKEIDWLNSLKDRTI